MAEYWDLYDKNRHSLGVLHERGKYLRKGTFHIVVGIWTINDEGKILLTLRSQNKRDWPDKWENTGGSVISGESSVHGAIRELYEETGIKASKDEMKLIVSERTRNAFVDCYVLRKNVSIGDIVFQEGETCGAMWASIDELEKMIENGMVAKPIAQRFFKVKHLFADYIKDSCGKDNI